jgi:hypothetical protein
MFAFQVHNLHRYVQVAHLRHLPFRRDLDAESARRWQGSSLHSRVSLLTMNHNAPFINQWWCLFFINVSRRVV